MTTPRHSQMTPGKWKAEWTDDGHDDNDVLVIAPSKDSDPILVADCLAPSAYDFDMPDHEIAIANARAIAKVPEMVALLSRITRTLETASIGEESLYAAPITQEARALLREIEGKE